MKPCDDSATAPAAPPCILVIFGAGGDLTRRLLIPALYNLAGAKLLDPHFAVIAVDHNERSEEGYRQIQSDTIRKFAAQKAGEFESASFKSRDWNWLRRRLHYLTADFEDQSAYERLKSKIAAVAKEHGTDANVIFYLATAPRFFGSIVERLGAAGLTAESNGSFRRVVVEKPFGTDLGSAKALNRRILSVLGESQVFRIDHFLGKETVQNIMALRFANGIFEPIWNRNHIDHVQITAAETVTVEGRGRFYDATGALRDMVPNHMFQLLAMTAMEAPNSFDADAVRAEKAKVIQAINALEPAEIATDVVRGQYRAGSIQRRKIPDYRREPNVGPRSNTETYVAFKLGIDNWRWAGVPFYLRTGKSLTRRRTQIAVQFKRVPHLLFRDTPVECLSPNYFVMEIQPDEGVTLQFDAKIPGPSLRLAPVKMEFCYVDYFKKAPSTGYETLIYDCMVGDATLFQRADNIEAGWAAVQPILDAWRKGKGGKVIPYRAGSQGPADADALLARDGRSWLPLD